MTPERTLMKRMISVAMMVPAILSLILPLTRARPMTDNQKYLNEAQTRATEFETELEPERLRESSMALENVVLAKEHDTKTRTQFRANCLSMWLHLLQILDQFLDPNFNPKDVPENLVQPPPIPGGV